MTDNKLDRIVIFRVDGGWLYDEMQRGRLRQGWGIPGLALKAPDGTWVDKAQWHENYNNAYGEPPSRRRYAILSKMLEIEPGELIVVPKMREYSQFTIAKVSETYTFIHGDDDDALGNDFRHIVPVDPDSVRVFDYRANNDAYLVSSLFGRANYRQAITFSYESEQIEAALRLLNMPGSTEAQPDKELFQATLDDVFKTAAEALREKVRHWNGARFERTVEQAFRAQGYNVKPYPRFDGQGADVDIVVSPPANQFTTFLPTEIAVQVKWKQGVDENDKEAVEQLNKWNESDVAMKYVISSADRFTPECRDLALEKGVVLIGGLETMCFLMGASGRYREEWDGDT